MGGQWVGGVGLTLFWQFPQMPSPEGLADHLHYGVPPPDLFPPASRRKLRADCHSYSVWTKATGRSRELCAGVTSSSLCRASNTAGNFQRFHLRLQCRCYYGWQYPYLVTLQRQLLFQRLLSLRMNSSLSKLAPNLSHDNIFTAKPIWSLSQNQIRLRLKRQIWRITPCQQGRRKSFGRMMKEMWIQNGSIKSCREILGGVMSCHTKNPPKLESMDTSVKQTIRDF